MRFWMPVSCQDTRTWPARNMWAWILPGRTRSVTLAACPVCSVRFATCEDYRDASAQLNFQFRQNADYPIGHETEAFCSYLCMAKAYSW